jgi:hypothetical protein
MAKGDLSCRLLQASNLAYAIKFGVPAAQQSQVTAFRSRSERLRSAVS